MRITFTFIFITTLSLISASTGFIYDSSGKKLVRGIPYYIMPLLRGSGGGLTLFRSHKDSCPLDVTQEPFEVNNGVPFTFNPIVLDEQVIREAYPVSVEADVTNPCTGSKIWQVTTSASAKDHHGFVTGKKKKKDEDDDKKKKHDDDDDDDDDDKDGPLVNIVTTGGEFNKPESCFQIVENNMMPGLQSYQIQNCPFKCGSSSTGLLCYNVGVITNPDGNRYLGRTDAVFPVVFTNSYDGTFSLSAKTSSSSEI